MDFIVPLKLFLLSTEMIQHNIRYVPLPFYYASNYSCLQHNLPVLDTENDIIALNGPECHDYLVGYQVVVPHAIVARKRAIRMQIGCSIGIWFLLNPSTIFFPVVILWARK